MSRDVSAGEAFAAGFSTVFAALGATASRIGQAVNNYLGVLGSYCWTAARGWADVAQAARKSPPCRHGGLDVTLR